MAVDTFPRNDEVVVMDNKWASDSFDLQPSQKVAQHGAGVVIVQTTRVKQRRIIDCCLVDLTVCVGSREEIACVATYNQISMYTT